MFAQCECMVAESNCAYMLFATQKGGTMMISKHYDITYIPYISPPPPRFEQGDEKTSTETETHVPCCVHH